MYTRRVRLDNAAGLHVRPATLFMAAASRFRCAIQVIKEGHVADGKSAISLMLLEAPRDTELIIQGDGDDEIEAVDALVTLIEQRFREPDGATREAVPLERRETITPAPPPGGEERHRR